MAPSPGGGRSPSTQPPPASPPDGVRRSTADQRSRPTPRMALLLKSVVRWGVLIGGLVIIADLATKAMTQGAVGADDVNAIMGLDELVNWVLFSILGIAVVRETGLFYAGALAGVLASLLDAILVAAANWMTPPAPSLAATQELFVQNVVVGTLFAAVSGVVYFTVQRWSGGRRPT